MSVPIPSAHIAWVVAFFYGLSPQLAWGCPACVGGSASDASTALYGLAGMLLLPLLLGLSGIVLARRLGSVNEAPDDGEPR